MYLVINKCVTAVKVSNFSGHYLRNRSTLDIGVLGYYYYYRYSALGPVWAETRAQSFDWYGSGTLHPGQVLRDSLPLLYCYIGIF